MTGKNPPTASAAQKANLHRVVDAISKLQTNGEAENAWNQYRIGRLVRKVQDEPANYGHASDETAVQFMAKELGCGKDTLYNAARISRFWTRKEFGRWVKKEGKDGARLTAAHFTEVLKLHDPNARDEMLARALAENMSSRAVRRAVEATQSKAPKPESKLNLLTLIGSSQKALAEWQGIDALVGDGGVDDVALIDKAAELQHQLSERCLENSKALHRALNARATPSPTKASPPGSSILGASNSATSSTKLLCASNPAADSEEPEPDPDPNGHGSAPRPAAPHDDTEVGDGSRPASLASTHVPGSVAHLPMRQPIDVYNAELTTGLERSPEFEKKMLGTHAINAGLKCSHACTYCSTNTLNRTHPKFKEIGRTSYESGFSIIDPTMVERVQRDAKKLGDKDTVIISTTVDAWAPDALRENLGRKLFEAVLCQPHGQVRILTKGAAVSRDFDLVTEHRERVLVGLSVTATPDKNNVIAAIEPNTAIISKRLLVMQNAAKLGLRVYGMMCPLFPGIADSPEQIDELVKFYAGINAEEIFAEAVNSRGNALVASQQALERAGFAAEAAAVSAVRKTAAWSEYVVNLVINVQRSVRQHYDISKLRFLLYADGLKPERLARIQSDDAGVIWLGKNSDVFAQGGCGAGAAGRRAGVGAELPDAGARP